MQGFLMVNHEIYGAVGTTFLKIGGNVTVVHNLGATRPPGLPIKPIQAESLVRHESIEDYHMKPIAMFMSHMSC